MPWFFSPDQRIRRDVGVCAAAEHLCGRYRIIEPRDNITRQLRAQEQQVKALQKASARILRRYGVGYSSYFEVIDADSSLYAARLLLVQARRNSLVNVVQLYKALGGGWDRVTAVSTR